MTNGQGVKFAFSTLYSEKEYAASGPLKAYAALSVCEEDDPPEYSNKTGMCPEIR